MNLLDISKAMLQALREDGLVALFEEVTSFCEKIHIPVTEMDDHLPSRGRS